jgi:hypothetical protein
MDSGGCVQRRLIWILAAAALLLAFTAYRLRFRSNLNVEPHAREVIEKAQQR